MEPGTHGGGLAGGVCQGVDGGPSAPPMGALARAPRRRPRSPRVRHVSWLRPGRHLHGQGGRIHRRIEGRFQGHRTTPPVDPRVLPGHGRSRVRAESRRHRNPVDFPRMPPGGDRSDHPPFDDTARRGRDRQAQPDSARIRRGR